MIIRKLMMKDFRKYRGLHKIDFMVDWSGDKNIVLIGGLNGNGKTSLMLALRMALFGKLNDDLWRRSSYHTFIADCLNRTSATEGKREFSLSIELETGDVAGLATLRIERRWRLSADMSTVSEQVHVFSSGRERLDLNSEEAELFILERIPYGISRFIFFDGDRLQDLVRQESFEGQVRQAVESIFGLKLYQDLASDLVAHERNLMRANSDSTELQKVMQAVDRAQSALEDIRQKSVALQAELSKDEERLAEIRNERIRLGVSHQTDRNEKDMQLTELRRERELVQQQLSTVVSFRLPFVLMRPQWEALRSQLEQDAVSDQEAALADLMGRRRDDLVEAFHQTAAAADTAALEEAWELVFGRSQPASPSRFAYLSVAQKHALIHQVDALVATESGDLGEIIRKIDKLDHMVRRLQSDLRDLPRDVVSLELEEREKSLAVGVRDLTQQLAETNVEERLKEHELATMRRNEESARLRQRLQEGVQRKVEAERRVAGTVREFVDRVSGQKIGEVQRYLTHMFQELTRSDQVVRAFAIDPSTYSISLMDDDGRRYDLSMLSEGEKQVFVLSFLWAVSMAAIEELPMVVDTPLGRLDSVHRQHIAERFFPRANRQTIVLSTDTEVDGPILDSIRPFVSQSYRLEYQPENQTTRILRGYFGE